MADFLLELRSEEIPARMQAKARNELARMFAECTSEAGLKAGPIDTFSTPRRLVLVARDVAGSTEASREELKGPRTSAPPQALEGFLRKTGLTVDQLEDRDGVYFAMIERAGRPAAEILAETIKRIVADFPWPKSMRWGDGSLRWVRPLHGIVAILGEEIVSVEVDGVSSGATTVGHRFHHPGPITIGGAADYAEKLRACHVIVDQEERERLIRDGAEAIAAAAGLKLLPDEALVVENAGLTEWPVPLIGRFDPEFLDVPREVIVLTMRTNQKYFACANDEGLLAPAFVCVANIDAEDDGKAIAEGNARVLAARLADARFFWEQDLKVPLEEQARKLDGIVFHEQLGTVADKVERVAKLARWLAEEAIVKGADADQTERAARLAKADLVTGMVGEFPELQGVIGGHLAAAQGEMEAVSDAIRDHYRPTGQGDEVPSSPETAALSLADKLDTLLGFFARGIKPTGSKDPFALRRASLSILSLLTNLGIRFDWADFTDWVGLYFVYDKALSPEDQTIAMFARLAEKDRNYRIEYSSGITKIFHGGELLHSISSDRQIDTSEMVWDGYDDLYHFLIERLNVQQREFGVRADILQATTSLTRGVLYERENDLVRLLARVKALQSFIATEDGSNLLIAYKRAANILKKEDWEGTDASGGPDIEAQEEALFDVLDAAELKAATAIKCEDFTAAMAALATLRGPIDQFFDHVTINDPDPAKRERRLNVLMRFRDAVNRVADFSKIEG